MDSGISDVVNEFRPLNKERLGVDVSIRDWAPKVEQRIPILLEKIQSSSNKEADKTLMSNALKDIRDVILVDNYQQFYHDLIDRSNICFCHNDAQERNILCSNEDNSRVTLIDYEYGDWNPWTYDLANFLNEWSCDNSYTGKYGIKFYPINEPNDSEIE